MQKLSADILVIDDDADILTAARVVLRQRFVTVVTENKPHRLLHLLNSQRFDVVLLDMNFSAGVTSGNEGLFWLKQILSISPQQQIIMITAYGDIELAVEAMKNGASDFVVKPWDNEKLETAVNAAVERAKKTKTRTVKGKQSENEQSTNVTEIVGQSVKIKGVLSTISKVANTEANVLLLGENGTGKDLFAKLIHEQSSRKHKPFIKVDVGSLSPGIFESELFGHKKGSFTDAKEDRLGRIESANGGTLFLDEVGNLPLQFQSKLLSVLQNREIVPLGSNTAIKLDIRFIFATNSDIHKAVNTGTFREDLLYRINTVEITLPPLRSRVDDIPLLANYFLSSCVAKYRKEDKSISDEAMLLLQKHLWPGNVRELQHAIERAVIMSDNKILRKMDFLLSSNKSEYEKNDGLNLDDLERNAIIRALDKYDGNLTKVALELGLGRTTLYRKMTKYGIEK